MKKRKHHYVWQHHLRAWARDGQVWCQRGATRFRTRTENIGQQRDFYRIREMSAADVQHVQRFIARMSGPARESAESTLEFFQLPHRLRRAHEAAGRRDPAIDRQIDIAINDLEENLHAGIESRAIGVLELLRRGDAAFLADDNLATIFAQFIATQHMRTARIMRRSVEACSDMIVDVNFEACWGVLRTIFANNIGATIFVQRRTLGISFLTPPPQIELVTCDQPLINVSASAIAATDDTPPTELLLYFPLSPSRALLLDCDRGTPRRVEHCELTVDQAARYNKMMVEKADQQIFAREEATLDSVGLSRR